MFRYFYKIFRGVIKPIEYVFTLVSFIIVFYILSIHFNIHQKIIDNFIQNASNNKNWTVNIDKITGIFPIYFRVNEIHFQSKSGESMTFSGTDVLFNWRTLRFNADVASLSHISASQKSSDSSLDTANLFKEMIQKQWNWVRWIGRICIQNSYGVGNDQTKYCLDVQANPKNSLVKLTADDPKNHYAIQLDQFAFKNSALSFHLQMEQQALQQKKWNIEGQAYLDISTLFLNAAVKSDAYPVLDQNQIKLKINHTHLPQFLNSFKQEDDLNSLGTKQHLFGECTLILNKEPAIIETALFADRSAHVEIFQKQKSKKQYPLFPMDFSEIPLVEQISAQIDEDKKLLAQIDLSVLKERINFTFQYNEPLKLQRSSEGALVKEFHYKLLHMKKNQPYVIGYGYVSKNETQLNTLTGELGGKKIQLKQPVKLQLDQRTLSPIWIHFGQHFLKTSAMVLKNSDLKDFNHFSLSPFAFHYSNNEGILHCGNLNLKGDLCFDEKIPFLNLSFQLAHHHCPTSASTMDQMFRKCLDISMNGKAKLSLGGIEISQCQIVSDKGRYTTNVKLKAIPLATDFIQYMLQYIKAYSFSDYGLQDLESQADQCILIDGEVKGKFSLTPIASFLKNGDLLRGILNTNLKISGSLLYPKLSGSVRLEDGLYENIGNGIVLKNIRMQAVGEEDTLKIQSIHLIDGTKISQHLIEKSFLIHSPPLGTAGGDGALRLFSATRHFKPELEVNLQCNYLQVAYSDLVKARASGFLKLLGPLHGAQANPTITGKVMVDTMTIDIAAASMASVADKNIRLSPISHKRTALVEPNPQPKLPVSRYVLKIDLHTGSQVIVKGDNGLKCFLHGHVIAKGPLENPYLVGHLSIDKTKTNTYNLFGKIMVANEGTIRYEEKYINDPHIHIKLQTKIDGKEVWAVVSGLTSAIHVALRSNPPMSNEAILSLLLFRQGLNELSANQNLRVKAFSSQMLQNNPLSFFDKLRHSIGLDSLEVVETQNMASGETVQTVRIGKQIKKVKVYLDQGISTKNNSKMTVRYDLTPQVGLEANVGTEKGTSGVGIQWMKRY